MVAIKRVALPLLLLWALAGCTTTSVSTGSGQDPQTRFTNTVWELRRVAGQSVDLNGERPHVIFLDDNRVSGYGGCNRFSGRYGTVSGEFRFLEMAATRETCTNAGVENRFLAAMRATRALSLTDDRLQLMDSAGVTVAEFHPAKRR